MNEEIIWPSLQPGDKWGTLGAILIQRTVRHTWVNMAWVDQYNAAPKILVKVWKNGEHKRYVTVGECDDLQQAVNMAAALVALGEADE